MAGLGGSLFFFVAKLLALFLGIGLVIAYHARRARAMEIDTKQGLMRALPDIWRADPWLPIVSASGLLLLTGVLSLESEWRSSIVARRPAAAPVEIGSEPLGDPIVKKSGPQIGSPDKDMQRRGEVASRKNHEENRKAVRAFVEMPVCAQDARRCPDGTWTSRTGPACEFRPCAPSGKARRPPRAD